MTKTYLKAGVATLLTLGLAMPVLAQRDPAYEAARANGSIGEKPDGYLGIVSGGDGQLQRLVNDINLKRKQVYTMRKTVARCRPSSSSPSRPDATQLLAPSRAKNIRRQMAAGRLAMAARRCAMHVVRDLDNRLNRRLARISQRNPGFFASNGAAQHDH